MFVRDRRCRITTAGLYRATQPVTATEYVATHAATAGTADTGCFEQGTIISVDVDCYRTD